MARRATSEVLHAATRGLRKWHADNPEATAEDVLDRLEWVAEQMGEEKK